MLHAASGDARRNSRANRAPTTALPIVPASRLATMASMTAISEEFQTNEAFLNKAFANAAARGLAAGRTHVLGLVIPMGVAALFTDPYFPILIQGVSSACNFVAEST